MYTTINNAQKILVHTMTSSNRNIFRVTGHLCGEFTGPREFPAQKRVTRSFDFSLICVWINDWVNNREAGDLWCYHAHYGVIVMFPNAIFSQCLKYAWRTKVMASL